MPKTAVHLHPGGGVGKSSLRPRVLVVDDDENNVQLVVRTLRREFEVVGLSEPQEAWDRLERENFELVLVDQRMPGVSGTELLERVRVLQPMARRVILSAFTEPKHLLDAINRCRVHRYLSKPVNPDELFACVRALTEPLMRRTWSVHVVDLDGVRGDALARAIVATSGDTISATCSDTVSLEADLVLLVMPDPDAVRSAIDKLGGQDRTNLVFAAMGPFAADDAAFYLNAGVDDILWPPVRPDEVIQRLRTCYERRNAELESARLRAEIFSQQGYFDLIGKSAPMHAIFEEIDRVAPTDATVLINGETGTGKELVARAIHGASHRHDAPFVAVNLSAVPETLIESELFGHEAGSFTGARQSRAGRFESVAGGTLFLDEIGDLSPSVQVKLLRVLQERKFERVGSTKSQNANFRLVCATHRNLSERVREGSFREDLFYRINVVRMSLPRLAERGEDVIVLAEYFLGLFSKRDGTTGLSLSDEARAELRTHDWPGNVRELRHAIERAVALSRPGQAIAAGVLAGREARRSFRAMTDEFLRDGRTLDELLTDIERTVLVETLGRYEGNQSVVAKKLGLARTTLRSRMKKLDL